MTVNETCMECGEPLGLLAVGNLCIGCFEMKKEEVEDLAEQARHDWKR